MPVASSYALDVPEAQVLSAGEEEEALSYSVWQGGKRFTPGHLQKVWLYLLALRWLLLGEG